MACFLPAATTLVHDRVGGDNALSKGSRPEIVFRPPPASLPKLISLGRADISHSYILPWVSVTLSQDISIPDKCWDLVSEPHSSSHPRGEGSVVLGGSLLLAQQCPEAEVHSVALNP